VGKTVGLTSRGLAREFSNSTIPRRHPVLKKFFD
jgi:hypothetical protein